MCADLEAATRVLRAERELPGDLTPKQKIGELLVFFVSESHAKLRRALGLDGNPAHPDLDDRALFEEKTIKTRRASR